jgi:hypothetical protein
MTHPCDKVSPYTCATRRGKDTEALSSIIAARAKEKGIADAGKDPEVKALSP